jgi:hypothetical protein
MHCPSVQYRSLEMPMGWQKGVLAGVVWETALGGKLLRIRKVTCFHFNGIIERYGSKREQGFIV